MSDKEILIVGDWKYPHYEKSLQYGFEKNGWIVHQFQIDGEFYQGFSKILWRAKTYPVISQLAKKLIEAIDHHAPGWIFIYRNNALPKSFFRKLRDMEIKIVLYHNDNPYIGFKRRLINRHFLRALPYSDLALVYRSSNLRDANNAGAERVEVLGPYIDSRIHNNANSLAFKDREVDVVYIGHYEADDRESTVSDVLKSGFTFTLGGFAPPWIEALGDRVSDLSGDVQEYFGEDYSAAIGKCKIGLVFLSKANQDVVTRRCFEMPACGTPCLIPRNTYTEVLYQGIDCLYSNSKELIRLLEKYCNSEVCFYKLLQEQARISEEYEVVSVSRRLIAAMDSARGYE